VGCRTDANPIWLGQRFQACGDIDTIAKNVAVFDNDIADINAHSEF
jgi:hypothetical protein